MKTREKKQKKQVMPEKTDMQFHKKYKACIMPTTTVQKKKEKKHKQTNTRELLYAYLPSTFELRFFKILVICHIGCLDTA